MVQTTPGQTEQPASRADRHATLPGDVPGATGTNQLRGLAAPQDREKPSSMWAMTLRQVRDPVNIVLIAVMLISIVGFLVAFSIILGAW